jgi:hypothetical protein
VTSDEIRVASAQIFVERGKPFVQETSSARRLGGKGWVEDKDWDDVPSFERGAKRWVIGQS